MLRVVVGRELSGRRKRLRRFPFPTAGPSEILLLELFRVSCGHGERPPGRRRTIPRARGASPRQQQSARLARSAWWYRVVSWEGRMANSPTHFEIPADDIARAKAFYEKTFGWKITQYPMPPGHEYWGVETMKKGEPGINGGLMKRVNPGQPFTNYISVTSI